MKFQGLSKADALRNQSLGLANTTIDSYVPSYPKIFFKNIFSLINIVVTPLLIFLALFNLKNEVLALSIFIVVNTITSVVDEIRIKKEIEKLKTQFQLKANVIRDEDELEIPVSEVVMNDLVVAREGESIIADGKVISASYLEVDESGLTGESDYIKKNENDQVYSGSFVITGICYYEVVAIGTKNYTNRLTQESTKYQKVKSPLQIAGDKMITTLTVFAIVLGLANFGLSYLNPANAIDQRILSLTTIIALIIPQTLIFLFTLTFSISISKLFKKGVLVQKGAAIENLTHIDTICIDKTGTITTNRMLLHSAKFWDFSEKDFYTALNAVNDKLYGVNKTIKVLIDKAFSKTAPVVNHFNQIPFNSKDKLSMFSGSYRHENENIKFTYILGAYESLESRIPKKMLTEVRNELNEVEKRGLRGLIILQYESLLESLPDTETCKVALYIFEEELNFGISSIISKFAELGIKLKIISGDSYGSVKTIASKVGLTTDKIVDLSKLTTAIDATTLENDIFTRAKPDDKVNIVNMLRASGHKVAMVGDGINDVLSLKAADVSISMESGAKVARNVSDIVLLNNDYSKLPDVFYEGDNIVFNLKLSTKMFLAKSVLAIIMAIFYTITFSVLPLLPATTLVFSFLGSSLPSYIIIFTRSTLKRQNDFLREVTFAAIPAGIIMAICSIAYAGILKAHGLNTIEINTGIALLILGLSLGYSLILLWQSGKLRSIGLTIFGFTIAFLAGTMQTILPVNLKDMDGYSVFTAIVLTIAAILLGWFLYKKINPQTIFKKILVGLLTVIWIPIVLIFPFRTYYSTARLEITQFIMILGTTGIGLLLMLLANYFSELLKKKIYSK